jgi:hypothetical protein
VGPYDIHTTIVEPGFCRTELLVDSSTTWPELSIEDYAPRTAAMIETWKRPRGRSSREPKAHFLKLRHESEMGPVATHCNTANTGGGMRHVSSKHPLPALYLNVR